ncbi:MAG: type II secretion system protein [Nitrospira sp.]
MKKVLHKGFTHALSLGKFLKYNYSFKIRSLNRYNLVRGFTLIELLAVISIIGLLSSVILSSLAKARDKGADANIKANLSNARTQAELFYADNSDSYGGVCGIAAAPGGSPSIRSLVTAAGATYGYTAVNGDFLIAKASNLTTVTCHSTASDWAAEVPLKSGGMWCVDSKGSSKAEIGVGANNSLEANSVVCD